LSGAAGQSTETPYTNRVNVSRLSGVNTEAFVRNASLLSRLGGDAELSSMVRFFYGKALHNPLTNKLFDAPDAVALENQIQQQIAFLKNALGGADVPSTYAGLAELGLTHDQFNAVVESVVATLRSQNIPPTVISEAEAYCEVVRASVVR
jgi:truncated hemoglobin YjbI